MEYRNIHKVITSIEEEAAPGFKIKRPLPSRGLRMIDPFLLLDHLGPIDFASGEGTGVPEHPHRGFEPVTFLFDGKIEHKDSLGNHIVLEPGDIQWMTAGSGIVHSEYIANEFKEIGGKFHGVQLWVNLPVSQRMSTPNYQNIKNNEIPSIEINGSLVRIFAGEVFDQKGPANTFTPILALQIILGSHSKIEVPIPNDYNAFIYVLEGRGLTNKSDIFQHQLVKYFNHGEGIDIENIENLNVLVLAGKPINEPIASYGPFVMNNMMEIQQAIYDYENGLIGSLTK